MLVDGPAIVCRCVRPASGSPSGNARAPRGHDAANGSLVARRFAHRAVRRIGARSAARAGRGRGAGGGRRLRGEKQRSSLLVSFDNGRAGAGRGAGDPSQPQATSPSCVRPRPGTRARLAEMPTTRSRRIRPDLLLRHGRRDRFPVQPGPRRTAGTPQPLLPRPSTTRFLLVAGRSRGPQPASTRATTRPPGSTCHRACPRGVTCGDVRRCGPRPCRGRRKPRPGSTGAFRRCPSSPTSSATTWASRTRAACSGTNGGSPAPMGNLLHGRRPRVQGSVRRDGARAIPARGRAGPCVR